MSTTKTKFQTISKIFSKKLFEEGPFCHEKIKLDKSACEKCIALKNWQLTAVWIIIPTVSTKSNFKLLLNHKMEDHQEDDK